MNGPKRGAGTTGGAEERKHVHTDYRIWARSTFPLLCNEDRIECARKRWMFRARVPH